MDDSHYGNAMTEIALALAMGFFSIMVLTMVSMGAGEGRAKETASAAAAMLAPPRTETAAVTQVTDEDIFVAYHDGRFLDRDLKPVTPESIQTTGRVVLALDPALPLNEAVKARGRINVSNLIVSTLDQRWLETLARMK